jgi:hypothetical protein
VIVETGVSESGWVEDSIQDPHPLVLKGHVLNYFAVLSAVVIFALGSSVAFSRLSGKSAFAAMGFAVVAVVCLVIIVFLAFTTLISQFG